MPTPPADAPLEDVPPERIAILARLYDRFAQALDPFSEERDQAERVFQQEVADLYDKLKPPKPDFRTFQRGIIIRCRRYLRATDKPSSL
jgi:hypothetical protein